MSICVVNGGPCQCQPSEGFPCPGVTALRAELAQAMKERSRAIAVGSDMEQEVERLREQLHLAEVARAAQVEGLTAGLDALRVDAKRYRWLLENHAIELVVIAWRYPAAVVFSTPNSAIDAARKGEA